MRITHKISKMNFTKHMGCNNNKNYYTEYFFLLFQYSTDKQKKKKKIIINRFHINIKNFHNNDGPNKITLTILSQLRITKVNTIKKLEKENNKITSQRINARNQKKGKKDHF